jgi:hypothetical protein
MTRRPKPVIHGRDHAPDGPDPIPAVAGDGIKFDTHPQDGGWLYVHTTGSDPTSPAAGIALLADEGGIYIDAATGQLSLFADDGDVVIGSTGGDIEMASGDDLRFTATTDINHISGRDVTVTAERDATIAAKRDVTLRADSDGTAGGNLILLSLPTSAPGVSHAVWNDAGTLKIT